MLIGRYICPISERPLVFRALAQLLIELSIGLPAYAFDLLM